MKNYNEMAESVLQRREQYERKQTVSNRKRAAACVIGFCFVILVGFGIAKPEPGNNDPAHGQITHISTYADMIDLTQTKKQAEKTDSEEPDQSGEDVSNNSDSIEDVPADANGSYMEAVDSTSLPEDTAAFFGGSYLDQNGRFTVVLTEDTPENRAKIAKELNQHESEIVFVTGKYTLAYLTDLMADISKAMGNDELPFVTTAALRENANCVEVGMTTQDDDCIKQVLAFDTLGGAIKVSFTSDNPKVDLLIKCPAE